MDLIFHLGFQLWRGAGGRAAMRDANLSGAWNVLAARPARVVLASSAGVYGAWPDNPLPLREDHPARPNPECGYAVDKLEVERRYLDALPCAALRIAAVLGPGVDPRVARATKGYRLGVPAVAGCPQAVQFLDEADAVAALVAGGWSEFTGICNVGTADWLDASAIAALWGTRVVPLPRRVLLAGAEAGRRLGIFPFGADRAVLLAGPLALGVQLAPAAIGWRPGRTSVQVLAAARAGRNCAAAPGLAS